MNKDERFDFFWKHTLILEGKYTVDTGGETMYGISKKAFPDEDIKAITKDRAYQLAKENYYNKLAQELPIRLAYIYFDCGFNCGVREANRMLQKALNSTYKMTLLVDGIVGEKTKTALQIISGTCSECELCYSMLKHRFEFYSKLAEQKSHKQYLRGWVNRLIKVMDYIFELKYHI